MGLAADYQRMGDRFENQQAAAYTKIVRDYPLSAHVDEAKARLEDMKRPVPEADPVAYARMKYELENRTGRSLLGKAWGPFSGKPDTSMARQVGQPADDRLPAHDSRQRSAGSGRRPRV